MLGHTASLTTNTPSFGIRVSRYSAIPTCLPCGSLYYLLTIIPAISYAGKYKINKPTEYRNGGKRRKVGESMGPCAGLFPPPSGWSRRHMAGSTCLAVSPILIDSPAASCAEVGEYRPDGGAHCAGAEHADQSDLSHVFSRHYRRGWGRGRRGRRDRRRGGRGRRGGGWLCARYVGREGKRHTLIAGGERAEHGQSGEAPQRGSPQRASQDRRRPRTEGDHQSGCQAHAHHGVAQEDRRQISHAEERRQGPQGPCDALRQETLATGRRHLFSAPLASVRRRRRPTEPACRVTRDEASRATWRARACARAGPPRKVS